MIYLEKNVIKAELNMEVNNAYAIWSLMTMMKNDDDVILVHVYIKNKYLGKAEVKFSEIISY